MSTQAIELNNTQFSYPESPEHTVLNIPNWTIAEGQQVFLQGPSGSGKSTLLGILSGILSPTSGEVAVFGNRFDQMKPRQRDHFRANHIGYVFQQFNLIPYLNAIENVQLSSHFASSRTSTLSEGEIKDLLAQLNINKSEMTQQIAKLSVGQQQRVAIARAIINKPRLLIADEPTSSLDQRNRDNFMQLMMGIVHQHQLTLLCVSHDLALATYFDQVETMTALNQQDA